MGQVSRFNLDLTSWFCPSTSVTEQVWAFSSPVPYPHTPAYGSLRARPPSGHVSVDLFTSEMGLFSNDRTATC